MDRLWRFCSPPLVGVNCHWGADAIAILLQWWVASVLFLVLAFFVLVVEEAAQCADCCATKCTPNGITTSQSSDAGSCSSTDGASRQGALLRGGHVCATGGGKKGCHRQCDQGFFHGSHGFDSIRMVNCRTQ